MLDIPNYAKWIILFLFLLTAVIYIGAASAGLGTEFGAAQDELLRQLDNGYGTPYYLQWDTPLGMLWSVLPGLERALEAAVSTVVALVIAYAAWLVVQRILVA